MIKEDCPVAVYTLFSSSAGNSIFVTDKKTSFLIDAGYNMKHVTGALSLIGSSLSEIKDVFVTHGHGDHTAALECMCKKYELTVRAAAPTAGMLRVPSVTINEGDNVTLGDFTVVPFRLSHDTPHCFGYKISHKSGAVFAEMTDTGRVTEEAKEALCGVDAVILESNYNDNMLLTGPYSPDLKARIRSDRGHLSNSQASEFLPYLYRYGTRRVMLAHISKENNTPELAYECAKEAARKFGLDGLEIKCADRSAPTRFI